MAMVGAGTLSGFQIEMKGRTALVTGASSGLGTRFAQILAASGANVVLAARRVDRLEQLRADIESRGGHAIAVAMDVTDEQSTIRAFDTAENAFGGVDSVIANAGMNIEGPTLEVDPAAVDAVFGVNVRGVFLTAREGARRLLAAGSAERKHGRIVIVSSITATAVTSGLAIYSASKAAVLQLGRVLAREWANKGINVNVICPGYIETDLNADWFQSERGRKHIQQWPRKRLMDASSLDMSLLYLASDAAEYVTGSVVTVDDGQGL
jgi:NAD(P)-dependent dehydrogenase (short-subunit alcohol dehydrogenase family)